MMQKHNNPEINGYEKAKCPRSKKTKTESRKYNHHKRIQYSTIGAYSIFTWKLTNKLSVQYCKKTFKIEMFLNKIKNTKIEVHLGPYNVKI